MHELCENQDCGRITWTLVILDLVILEETRMTPRRFLMTNPEKYIKFSQLTC